MNGILINMRKIGKAKGTVGWLAAQAESVEFTESKLGKRGAWLNLKSGEQICLVVADPYGIGYQCENSDRLDTIKRYDYVFGLPFAVTDACWDSIHALANMARNLMRESDKHEKPIRFRLTKVDEE